MRLLALACLLATSLATAEGLDLEPLRERVEQCLKTNRIPGCSVGVVQSGQVGSLGFGYRRLATKAPCKPDTVFQIGSTSKTFAATLLLEQARTTKLELDHFASQYACEGQHLPTHKGQGFTLRQLAIHTSGLPREFTNRQDLPNSPSVMLPYSVDELHAGFATTKLGFAPGTRWSYSNLGPGLLGHLLEHAAETTYEDLQRRALWTPLGLSDTTITLGPHHVDRFATHYWPEDEALTDRPRWEFGSVNAWAGIASTAPDLCRFVAAHFPAPEEPVDTTRYLDPSVVHQAWRPQAKLPDGLLRKVLGDTGLVARAGSSAMGLGWLLADCKGVGLTAITGGEIDGHSSLVVVFPKQQVGVVVLANLGDDGARKLGEVVLPWVLERLR